MDKDKLDKAIDLLMEIDLSEKTSYHKEEMDIVIAKLSSLLYLWDYEGCDD